MVKYFCIIYFIFITKIVVCQNKYVVGTHVKFQCEYFKKDTSFKIKSHSGSQYITNYRGLESVQYNDLRIDSGCCFKIRATNEFGVLQCLRAGDSVAYLLWHEDTSVYVNVANLRVYRFILLVSFFDAKVDLMDFNYMSDVFGNKASISISPNIILYSVMTKISDSSKIIEIMTIDKKRQRPIEVIDFADINDNIFITGRQTFVYRNRRKWR